MTSAAHTAPPRRPPASAPPPRRHRQPPHPPPAPTPSDAASPQTILTAQPHPRNSHKPY